MSANSAHSVVCLFSIPIPIPIATAIWIRCYLINENWLLSIVASGRAASPFAAGMMDVSVDATSGGLVESGSLSRTSSLTSSLTLSGINADSERMPIVCALKGRCWIARGRSPGIMRGESEGSPVTTRRRLGLLLCVSFIQIPARRAGLTYTAPSAPEDEVQHLVHTILCRERCR